MVIRACSSPQADDGYQLPIFRYLGIRIGEQMIRTLPYTCRPFIFRFQYIHYNNTIQRTSNPGSSHPESGAGSCLGRRLGGSGDPEHHVSITGRSPHSAFQFCSFSFPPHPQPFPWKPMDIPLSHAKQKQTVWSFE